MILIMTLTIRQQKHDPFHIKIYQSHGNRLCWWDSVAHLQQQFCATLRQREGFRFP